MSPYHTTTIPKGKLGESSKIFEEVAEFRDAILQQNPVLALCEIADILGAIEAYTQENYKLSLDDIYKMTLLNKKAFESGYRS